jgi:transcriptional regulator with XRE-family HTH domain
MPVGPRRSAFPGLGAASVRRHELIEQLARARRESGLSQTELAARMGTSQSAVARLESGELDARLSTLERYAAALGRAVDWHVRPPESSTRSTTPSEESP